MLYQNCKSKILHYIDGMMAVKGGIGVWRNMEKRGSKEEFEGRRGMLTTGEWCNPISNNYYSTLK